MTTLENTISMMKTLPETDLVEIQNLTKKLFQRHECETVDKAVGEVLPPMSREDFLSDIETAEQEITDGKYRPAEEVWNGLEHKYGLGGDFKRHRISASRKNHAFLPYDISYHTVLLVNLLAESYQSKKNG